MTILERNNYFKFFTIYCVDNQLNICIFVIMNQSFGQLLKNIRRDRGISQRDLAEQVGIDFSYISKIENDRLPPPAAETTIRIAKILGVSEEILLAGSNKISSDMSNAISSSQSAIKFMNEVKLMGLSENEWDQLTQSLKKLR